MLETRYNREMQWLLLTLGGALGTVARYGVSRIGVRLVGEHWFPAGTFAANLLGSLLLGVVFVLGEERTIFGADARLVLGTGVMGGFTTYSSFNLEALQLLSSSALRAVLYIVATVLLCLAAGWLGLSLGRALR